MWSHHNLPPDHVIILNVPREQRSHYHMGFTWCRTSSTLSMPPGDASHLLLCWSSPRLRRLTSCVRPSWSSILPLMMIHIQDLYRRNIRLRYRFLSAHRCRSLTKCYLVIVTRVFTSTSYIWSSPTSKIDTMYFVVILSSWSMEQSWIVWCLQRCIHK